MKKEREEISKNSNFNILPYVTFVGDLCDDGAIDERQIVVEVNDDVELMDQEGALDQDDQLIPIIDVQDLPNHPEAHVNQIQIEHNPIVFPEVHVVIEEKSFKIGSNKLVDAVDTCYKAIQLLNIGFPGECRHYWVLLCILVYKYKQGVFKYKNVADLISELEKISID